MNKFIVLYPFLWEYMVKYTAIYSLFYVHEKKVEKFFIFFVYFWYFFKVANYLYMNSD